MRTVSLADTTALTVLHDKTAIEDKMRSVFAGGSGNGAAGGAAGGAAWVAASGADSKLAVAAEAEAAPDVEVKNVGGLFGGRFFKSPADILGGMKAGVENAFADVKNAGEAVVSTIEKTNAAAVASIDKHANKLGGGGSPPTPSRSDAYLTPYMRQSVTVRPIRRVWLTPSLPPPLPSSPHRPGAALSKSIGHRVVTQRMQLRCYGFQLSTTQDGGGLTLLLRSEEERDLWIERLRHALPFSVAGSARHNPNRTLDAARLIQRRFRECQHARERAAAAAAASTVQNEVGLFSITVTFL